MIEQRKVIYDKRKLTSGLILAAGTLLEKPANEYDWQQLEAARKELSVIRERVNAYVDEIDNFLTDNCEDWQKQWDLANELYAPYNEPYDIDAIVVKTLAQEFEEKGLVKELAEMVAYSVKNPVGI